MLPSKAFAGFLARKAWQALSALLLSVSHENTLPQH
jgi:hypothetical protein